MSAAPYVSVVVRSYNRWPALCELLEALLAQEGVDFEIVVVDQTTKPVEAVRARLEALCADPRVRRLRFPPLGGPRARNEGVRAARGAIIALIDDDDLPGDRGWLAALVKNFADPRCLGVTGRSVVEGGGARPYRNMARAERRVMSLSWLGWQRPYALVNVRKQVDSVHGGNVAIRREAIERAGLWDECTPVEDELSFAYRLRARLRPGEYLLFDPTAVMQRRFDVPGGMDKRYQSTLRFAHRHFLFFVRIVGHYLPWRFWLLQPAYVGLLWVVVADWLWSDSERHRGLAERLPAIAGFTLALPFAWIVWMGQEAWRRVRSGPLPHHPTLAAPPPAARP